MDVLPSQGPQDAAQSVLWSAGVADRGTGVVVGEVERRRHSADYEASVDGRPVGWKEEQSDRTGVMDDDSAGQGRLGVDVVDPSTDGFDS